MRTRAALTGLLLVLVGFAAGCSSDEPPAAESPAAEPPAAEPATRAGTLAVAEAWARPGRPGGMSAVYARLQNGTATADTLRAVATAAANTVEIHESYENEDGTRGMRPIGPLPVPSGDEVTLEPGGKHIMLIRLNDTLQAGDSLRVEFEFARAGMRTLAVPIRMQPPQ